MAQGKGFLLQLQSKREAEEFCKYGRGAWKLFAGGRRQRPGTSHK